MAWEFLPDQPIYTQLVLKLQADIIAGEYGVGSKFPSVRELSQVACVNPNTMQRAFVELEQLGFIKTKRTAGRVVTDDLEHLQLFKRQLASNYIDNFIDSLDTLGYETAEIKTFLQLKIKGGNA